MDRRYSVNPHPPLVRKPFVDSMLEYLGAATVAAIGAVILFWVAGGFQ